MFKLVFFLIGLAIAILFSAFNIGNTTDISFGFTVLEDIPVFLSIAISFLAGSVFTLPFAFSVSMASKKKKKKIKDSPAEYRPEPEPEIYDDSTPENFPVD